MLLAFGAGCLNPCAPSPPTNSCGNPEHAVIDSIAIGPGEAYGGASLFRAWQDGDGVKVVEGGQGAHMIVARIEVTGSAGRCLSQNTVVRDEQGKEIAGELAPVEAGPATDARGAPIPGTVDSYPIFLPGAYPLDEGTHLRVTATSGGHSVTRTLVIVSPYADLAPPPDLALDLAPSDDR